MYTGLQCQDFRLIAFSVCFLPKTTFRTLLVSDYLELLNCDKAVCVSRLFSLLTRLLKTNLAT